MKQRNHVIKLGHDLLPDGSVEIGELSGNETMTSSEMTTTIRNYKPQNSHLNMTTKYSLYSYYYFIYYC